MGVESGGHLKVVASGAPRAQGSLVQHRSVVKMVFHYTVSPSAIDVAAVTDFQDENQEAIVFDAVENSENAHPNAVHI